MRLFEGSNVVFVHIPKTGGQSVVDAFGLKHKTTDHSLGGPEQEHLLSEDFIRFCVVRNPFDRFVSAYRYSVYMTAINNVLPERKFIVDHGLTRDVNGFIATVEEHELDLSKAFHFRPMSAFIRLTRPQIILRLENLDRDIHIIRRLVPDSFRGLSRLNASDERESSKAISTKLNAKSRRFVERLYKRDFDLLGYK